MDEKVCILYGKNHFTALRLETIFKNVGFKFLYSKNHFVLKKNIALAKKDLVCIFVEIEDNYEAIGLINDAKASAASVPLIVLSDIPKRTLFINAIVAGAIDFIVKPFEDSLLMERISKLMDSPDSNFNYNEAALEIIRIELIKSQKGKYHLGFGLITFFNPVKAYNAKLEQQYRKDLPEVFLSLGKSLFETDIKQLIGSQSMLVALTFCTSEQIPVVENKITELYEKLKSDHSLLNKYSMVQVFYSKLEDSFEAVDILNVLMSKTKATIENQREKFNKVSSNTTVETVGEK